MHVCARVDYVPPSPGSRRKGGKESNPVATSCVRDCNFTPTQLSRPSSRRWSIDRPPDRALPYPLPPAVSLPRVGSLPFCPSFTLVREVSFFFLPPDLSLALSFLGDAYDAPAFRARCVNRGLLLSCQCCVEHGCFSINLTGVVHQW